MPSTKRITNYCNYATWNCDVGEGFAHPKSTLSNRCDTIWNIYVSEGFTTAKSILSNRCDTIWNVYAGEEFTTQVFANAFISVTYVLNGRKVTAKILKRSEKMKI